MTIHEMVKMQREAYASAPPPTYRERMAALCALRTAVEKNEAAVLDALKKDLNKTAHEAYMTEIGMVLSEITDAQRHLKRWMRPMRKAPSVGQIPAQARMYKEPYGVVLIMAPWNYPFQLSLSPLVGALAAGNRCIVKPSNYAPETASILSKIITEAFEPSLVSVVLGGRAENSSLLDEKFDYIFFTGGVTVGRLVLEKAAQHVTPVTLELGGKSPVIVEKTADIALAAKRIAFGKCLNSGQTCVAPDYCLADESIRDELLKALAAQMREMFGDALHNDAWPRMVNEKHYRRVLGLIENQTVYYGGHGADGRIEPTVLTDVSPDSPVMREEIFGPVLPVLTYTSLDQAVRFIREREKPLALYLFTEDKAVQEKILSDVSFGGGCINDTIIHLASSGVPFGGVGQSGMGRYHGKSSFDTFTHEKTVVKKCGAFCMPLMYPPFTEQKLNLLKKVLK